MTADMSSMFWHSNKEWYRINIEKDCYELTDKAPKEAVESFALYCERAEEAEKDRAQGIFRW